MVEADQLFTGLARPHQEQRKARLFQINTLTRAKRPFAQRPALYR
jgi:hypothetical protein